jgi:hypothetical protein
VSSKTKIPEPFDLERDVPTTEEDVAALRRIRESRKLSFAEYLRFVSRLPMSEDASRSIRTHEDQEPFEL